MMFLFRDSLPQGYQKDKGLPSKLPYLALLYYCFFL
nr:MAG TPA: hypothetical protein [Caudoviricetes sp.]